MQRRILAHVKLGSGEFISAHFTQSIIDTFAGKDDSATVYSALKENKFCLSDMPQFPDSHLVQIKRPSFCPIHLLNPTITSQLPLEIQDRGIDVGCALILESVDGFVLLTRRASHMRTFPGVWVPPGGHVEDGESLIEATLRELLEETGINITVNDVSQPVSTLALWESAYPPMLSLGLPVRHHIVAYMYAKLRQPLTRIKLQSMLQLCPSEVDAATWITKSMARAIVAVSDVNTDDNVTYTTTSPASNFPDTVLVTVVNSDGKQTIETQSSRNLLNCAPTSGRDIERVSTGTKFALSQWILLDSAV
jgi:ADP-ribose pyrophosphatase YjhB (NUDIX family)